MVDTFKFDEIIKCFFDIANFKIVKEFGENMNILRMEEKFFIDEDVDIILSKFLRESFGFEPENLLFIWMNTEPYLLLENLLVNVLGKQLKRYNGGVIVRRDEFDFSYSAWIKSPERSSLNEGKYYICKEVKKEKVRIIKMNYN